MQTSNAQKIATQFRGLHAMSAIAAPTPKVVIATTAAARKEKGKNESGARAGKK
ncbi:MAG: hypothetical protein HONDAALG_01386 [Gammaproteobacteria bacterium]|nr:hypothetical protein [Gammaproteobacteria bacterium]